MKERPILMNGPMVRATLEGRKTQTRRPVDLGNLHGILPHAVRGDSIFSSISAKPGKHKLLANPNFAVSADLGDEKLGLRPGEFNFLSPLAGECTAETDNRCWTLKPVEPCRLWVRETWMDLRGIGGAVGNAMYRATFGNVPNGGKWFPSIHMPRWASRIALEVTGVRIERLQDISEDDAKAEGLIGPHHLSAEWSGGDGRWFQHPKDAFRNLWDGLYQKERNWDANPWVWVIEFVMVKP